MNKDDDGADLGDTVLFAGPPIGPNNEYGANYFFDPSLPSFAVPSGMTFEQAWSVFSPYLRRTFIRGDRGATNRFLGVLEHLVGKEVYNKICDRCLEWVVGVRTTDAERRRRQASNNERAFLRDTFLGRNGIDQRALDGMWEAMDGAQRPHMERLIDAGEQEFRRRANAGFDNAWEAAQRVGWGVAAAAAEACSSDKKKKKKKPSKPSSSRKRKRSTGEGRDGDEEDDGRGSGSSGSGSVTEDEPSDGGRKRRKRDEDDDEDDGGGKPAARPRGFEGAGRRLGR